MTVEAGLGPRHVDAHEALVVGVDYGTLSGRAVVVRVRDGAELGSAVHEYPHAVMERALTAGPAADAGSPVALAPDWALQVPSDYVAVLTTAVPAALAANRERAGLFAEAWNRHVSAGQPLFESDPRAEAIIELQRGEDPFDVLTQMRTLWE